MTTTQLQELVRTPIHELTNEQLVALRDDLTRKNMSINNELIFRQMANLAVVNQGSY